jgi:hypothetical protein
MSVSGETPFLERIAFFDGQRLLAADLDRLERSGRELRWLHNRSLHQPGIGRGYAVAGARAAREVTIDAGYAIDALGREIVLTEPCVEQVPPVADDGEGRPVLYDLTVAYPDDEALEESETRVGVCATQGVVRRREAPVFCWVKLDAERQPLDPTLRRDVHDGLRLIVARAEVLDCRLNRPLSVAERRSARPAQQPWVASGRTEVEGWTVEVRSRLGIVLSRTVDTSNAGFRVRPTYFADILGEREFNLTGVGGGAPTLLDGFVSVFGAEPAEFLVSVLLPLPVPAAAAAERLRAEIEAQIVVNAWRVQWMGIEG